MGWLNTERPPSKWSAAFFAGFVERLRTAVNYLDSNNFLGGLDGGVINNGTLPLSKISGVEFQHTFFALAEAYTTASTSLVTVGGYLSWDNIWGDAVELKLEVVGGSSNVLATATFELHGVDGILASVTSNTGNIELLRSAAFTAPTISQTFLVKVKTSNGTYTANALSARLIITIK